MNDPNLQDIFNRVYLYLVESGVDMTVERDCKLLQLLEHAVRESSGGETTSTALQLAIDNIRGYFDLPPVAVPEICPPLKRGSIGYDPPPSGHDDV